jgi:hypothetical protein
MKRMMLLLLCVGIANFGLAQTAKDVFDEKTPITWLGLDFTGAKFAGDREKIGSEEDLHKLMTAWNNLMINEPEKFDVGKALHRLPLKQAVDIAIAHNEKLNLQGTMTSAEVSHLSKEDVSRIVASYDFGAQSGIGVLFVVDSFSKIEEEGIVWVTFINMSSKELISTNRITAKPVGFGLRNYWAGAIYGMLKKIRLDYYDKWKKNYK